MAVQTQIQTRRGTAATWTSTNPTLAAGEIGFESDTNKFKIGTGSTAWTALAYAANTSPLTTKGDLYTYSTTNDRLAVGNNGESLVADSSTSTGLRYQGSITGGKNFAINGGMDIWQRGTSFTSTGAGYAAYTVDRWVCYAQGTGSITQDTSLSASGFRYGLKFTSTAASSGNDWYQLVETDQTVPLAGKQVAVSGYCIATTGALPLMNLEYSTTVNDTLFGTYVQCTKTTISQPTADGTLLRYTYSFAVPSTAKTLRLRAGTGSLNNTNYATWTGIQLEVGNVPTLFSRAGGTIQGELAACQRYYTRWQLATNNYADLFLGQTYSTTQAYFLCQTPIEMRTVPTGARSGLCVISNNLGSRTSGGTWGVTGNTNKTFVVTYTHGSATFTAGQVSQLQINNSSSDYLEVTAEL